MTGRPDGHVDPPARPGSGRDIAAVAALMADGLAGMSPADPLRYFLATYLRTTQAIADALDRGVFSDPGWVDRWDVAFADLYLSALHRHLVGRPVPGPWRVAFGAAAARPEIPPVIHVLFGINAHINYDLPQALLAVITDDEFTDPELLARRDADHRRIDAVLSARVSAEDAELAALSGPRRLVDHLMGPANRLATRRFLREARKKVWANAGLLALARGRGAADLAGRLAELERLSAARVADLARPGPVLLRLAVRGFGVRLSPDLPPPVGPQPTGAD